MSKPFRADFCPHCRGTGLKPDQAAIGGELRNLRKASAISLRDMARRLKLSHGFLCQLESGRRRWNVLVEQRYLKECEKG